MNSVRCRCPGLDEGFGSSHAEFAAPSNEKRIRVARSRDTILGWTKSGHEGCEWGSYRVSASNTDAVSRRDGRSHEVSRSGGRGCERRGGRSAAPGTCGHGRSATRRHSRPIGAWRQAAEGGVSMACSGRPAPPGSEHGDDDQRAHATVRTPREVAEGGRARGLKGLRRGDEGEGRQ